MEEQKSYLLIISFDFPEVQPEVMLGMRDWLFPKRELASFWNRKGMKRTFYEFVCFHS